MYIRRDERQYVCSAVYQFAVCTERSRIKLSSVVGFNRTRSLDGSIAFRAWVRRHHNGHHGERRTSRVQHVESRCWAAFGGFRTADRDVDDIDRVGTRGRVSPLGSVIRSRPALRRVSDVVSGTDPMSSHLGGREPRRFPGSGRTSRPTRVASGDSDARSLSKRPRHSKRSHPPGTRARTELMRRDPTEGTASRSTTNWDERYRDDPVTTRSVRRTRSGQLLYMLFKYYKLLSVVL